ASAQPRGDNYRYSGQNFEAQKLCLAPAFTFSWKAAAFALDAKAGSNPSPVGSRLGFFQPAFS
ncbi:MAG: hypothetical protein CRN43_20115, partial [Candidatus Nephrothrix sp. EaCA]